MPKTIIVAGYHRNAELAGRNLSRLIRESGSASGRILARRNDRGAFSVRGRNFTFELTAKPKRKRKKRGGGILPGKLFRLTVAITYPHGKKGNYVGYYLKHWQGARRPLSIAREEELIEVTVSGLEKHLDYPRDRFWFDLEKVTSIEQPTKSGESPTLKGTWELFSDEDSEVTGQFKSLSAVVKFIEEFEA